MKNGNVLGTEPMSRTCKACFKRALKKPLKAFEEWEMSHVCKLNVMFLRDLVPFVQFKKREKHPSRSVTFSKVAGLKPATLLKVKFFHGCFSRFLNCVNGTKSHNASYLVLLEIWNLSVQSVFANVHYKKLSMIHFILW